MRLLFVFVGALLCLYVTGYFIWLAGNIVRLADKRYKTVPLLIEALGIMLFVDTLWGYLGKTVWEVRNAPGAGDEWLVIPIAAGAVIFMIGSFIHARQYGSNFLYLLTQTNRKREGNEPPR